MPAHEDSLGGETFSGEEQQDPAEQSLGDGHTMGGRGTVPSRYISKLVPLSANTPGHTIVLKAAGFGLCVSWISSVVILDLCNSASLDSERPHIYVRTFDTHLPLR